MRPRTLAAALLLAAIPAGAEIRLRDVQAESGIDRVVVGGSQESKRYIIEENGSGAALFDYDGDGDLDVYLVNGSDLEILAGKRPPVADALYRNDGDGRFVDVTAAAGVGDTGWGTAAAVGDVDGDGDPDLYVTNWGPNVFYENLGDGRFRDATAAAGLGDPGWGHSAAFGDLDGDGDLDLYVANNLDFDIGKAPTLCPYREMRVACGPIGFPPQPDRLFVNDGAGRFADGSVAAGVHAPDPQYGLGVVLADLDDDGRADVYVANDSGPNFLFRALPGGRFEEIAWMVGLATQAEGRFQAGMGVDAGDVDGDLDLDVVVTNFSFDHDTLYRQIGDGLFQDASYPSGLGGASYRPMGWGARLVDLDHDGDLDLYVSRGHIYPEVDAAGEESFRQADAVFANDGAGRFQEVTDALVRTRPPGSSRGAAFGDLDGDGDQDAVVIELGDAPALLRNEGGAAAGAWLQVGLVGRRGPPDGEGARVVATAGGRSQRRDVTRSGSYASQHDVRAHFGLGEAPRVERLDVRWPGGGHVRLVSLPVRRVLRIVEP